MPGPGMEPRTTLRQADVLTTTLLRLSVCESLIIQWHLSSPSVDLTTQQYVNDLQ